MPSLYTPSGVELIGPGEQSGSWNVTTNTNLQILDRMISQAVTISLSGTTHTLTLSDGVLSDGQYGVLVFGGSPSGTNTVTISPNDARRTYFVKNDSGETVVLTQGSGGNVSVETGKGAIVYCDGAGSGAEVVDLTATFIPSLPSLGITASAAEINILDGATITTAELNVLDGVTATTAELNQLDGNIFTGNLTVDTNTLFVDAANNRVGVGTTETSLLNGIGGSANLVVTGSDSTTTVADNSGAALVIANTDDTANNLAGLHFAWQDTDNALNYAGASIVSILGTKVVGQYPAGQLAFLTSIATNNAPSEKMRITSTGNVGIGTSSPDEALEVVGAVKSTGLNLTGGASDWTFALSGNNLIISYGGVGKAKLDTSGNLTVTGNITAYGTV